jgi:hypothetical protein
MTMTRCQRLCRWLAEPVSPQANLRLCIASLSFAAAVIVFVILVFATADFTR